MPRLSAFALLFLLTCQLLRGSVISKEDDHLSDHAGGHQSDHAGGHQSEHASDHQSEHTAAGDHGGDDHWEKKKWDMAAKIDGIVERINKFKLNFIARKIEKLLPAKPGTEI